MFYDQKIIDGLSQDEISNAYRYQQEQYYIQDVENYIKEYYEGNYSKEQLLADNDFISAVIDKYEDINFNIEGISLAIDDVLNYQGYTPKDLQLIENTVSQTNQKHKRLFVDMDGTLARFHDEPMYLERMFEKDFFRNLKPFEKMVEGLKRFKDRNPDVEIFILSAAVNGEPPYCRAEKNAWIDKHLPEIDKEHRIFTKVGIPKSAYVPGGISKEDVLLDDYNVGLEQWERDGGRGIKAKNNINHKGLHGKLWTGQLISITEESDHICSMLEMNMSGPSLQQHKKGRER